MDMNAGASVESLGLIKSFLDWKTMICWAWMLSVIEDLCTERDFGSQTAGWPRVWLYCRHQWQMQLLTVLLVLKVRIKMNWFQCPEHRDCCRACSQPCSLWQGLSMDTGISFFPVLAKHTQHFSWIILLFFSFGGKFQASSGDNKNTGRGW